MTGYLPGYQIDSNGKPIIYPLVGPGGHRLTRDFPMKDAGPNERDDHDHHRSLWLTHGDVNGVICRRRSLREDCSSIRVKRFIDGSVVLTTENDWNDPDGERLLSDVRRYHFQVIGDRRVIDADLLVASDGDVNFGDTKEGSFWIACCGNYESGCKERWINHKR